MESKGDPKLQTSILHCMRLPPILWLLTLVTVVGIACSKRLDRNTVNADHWTCGMHPAIRSKTPGKCPICGMDLVAVIESRATKPNLDEFTISASRQKRLGVTYTEVRRMPIRTHLRAVGTLDVEQDRNFDCVSRVDGYIERLLVYTPGERVSVGQPLMVLYSPDLRPPEQEFVNLLKVRESGSVAAESIEQLIDAARRRLGLLKVGEAEISELERTRQPSDYLLFRSPFDGVVAEAPMRIGTRVKQGDRLMSVIDPLGLRLWADFYESDVGLIKEGQRALVTVPAFPDHSFEARVTLVGPLIDPVKRTAKVCISISNDGQLRPGMYADVSVEIDLGEGIGVPFDSVLPTGSKMLVFVDRGFGKLEPRAIQVAVSSWVHRACAIIR
jgi:membrane fusion protein, copper/silver efflux system